MVVVQPILATTVIFSLPLGAKLSGQRIGRRELTAAGVTTGGLAAVSYTHLTLPTTPYV